MDWIVLAEIWDNIKDDITDKNRVTVLKNMLLVLEDNDEVDEDSLLSFKEHDDYCQEAVSYIYKRYEDEDAEEEFPEEDESEW